MLKRKKKTEEDAAQPRDVVKENTRGVTGEGDTLQRYTLFAALGTLVAVLAAFAYLFLLRESSLQQEQLQRVSDSFAAQQAASINGTLSLYGERLQAAAKSPLALAAIASRNPQDVALVEKALLDYFPRLASIRLITIGNLGTASLESEATGLRNHIEIDLLRRAAEAEPTPPESYRYEGSWLTSFAELVEHPQQSEHRAVILATIDNSVLTNALADLTGESGRLALQQIYRQGSFERADDIAAAGSAGSGGVSSEMSLNGGTWKLVFTPSSAMLNRYAVNSIPLIAVFGLILLVVIGAFIFLLMASRRALVAESEQIMNNIEGRTPLVVGIPAMLAMAREMRRLSERQSRQPAAAVQAAAPQAPAAVAEETAPTPEGAASDTPADGTEGGETLPAHIFRAYDIRGVVDQELDEQTVSLIGRALGTLAEERGEQALIVGFDGRKTSPNIKTALVRALVDSGRDVIDIGCVPTPALYFATNTMSSQSGIMVTASHNPAEYNGFKITLGGHPLAGDDLKQLAELVKLGKFSEGAGRLAKKDVSGDYVEAIINDIAISSPLKVVVDAGNGAAGELAPQVLEGLGCEVTRLYCDIDGDFPNHHPDPSVDANLADLQAKVVEVGADFGVAYDGDGDRMSVVTAEGRIVRNDMLLMLFAQDIVSRNPGSDVVFDIKCSRQVAQLVTGLGGRPIMWKTGHAFMREKVIESGALLGGEFSGHFYFGERWYGFDDAIYASARLAEFITGTGSDLTTLLSQFATLEHTPEIHIPVPDQEKFEVMRKITEEGDFSPGKVTTLDGVRVDYSDGWGLLRASNTTPALIARFEGNDADAMRRIMDQFREQVSRLEPELELGF